MPAFSVLKIWKDHEYQRGKNVGVIVEARPAWSIERGGYDVYPRDNNLLSDAKTVSSLDELRSCLSDGFSVRCHVPENGDTPILKGPFKAVVETQDV